MNKKIIFLLHIPPPVHGSSVVGLAIKESDQINEAFDCSTIDLLASQVVAESGELNIKKLTDFVGTFTKLIALLVRKRPHLCYVALTSTGLAFYRDFILIVTLKFFGVKRIYHLHNKGIHKKGMNPIHNFFYRYIFDDAEVVLLSRRLFNDIKNFVPNDRVHICANGLSDMTLGSNHLAKKNKEVIRVLFLSNLIVTKGIYVLLEAVSLLKQKGLKFVCQVAGSEGDIKLADFKEKIQDLGIADYIKYLGRINGVDKEKAFSRADIFVFPTYYETFGLVNIEAMQFSLPVISTYEGGIPDIVEDGVTGFLVPQRNDGALSEKLHLLIENKALRESMGAAGRRKYEQNYTLEIFENRMVEILEGVLNKN